MVLCIKIKFVTLHLNILEAKCMCVTQMYFWKSNAFRVTQYPYSGTSSRFVDNYSWEDSVVMLVSVFFSNYSQLSAFGHCKSWAVESLIWSTGVLTCCSADSVIAHWDSSCFQEVLYQAWWNKAAVGDQQQEMEFFRYSGLGLFLPLEDTKLTSLVLLAFVKVVASYGSDVLQF